MTLQIIDIISSRTNREEQMPGDLYLQNLDDDLIERLRYRAARHGRTTDAEHREILREALSAPTTSSFETQAAALRSMTKGRNHTPSEQLLEEGRSER